MERKQYLDEDTLKILCKIDVHLHHDHVVLSSCHKAGFSEKIFFIDEKSLM